LPLCPKRDIGQDTNGKAKLVSETCCDGLGACLGECPRGAITIEERSALRFHEDFLAGHTLLIACPKLDNFKAHEEKLTEIIRRNNLKSLTVLRMEVSCCSGLTYMAGEAIEASGKNVPLTEVIISVRGDIKEVA
jgi:ferredoxin